jgi:hypothetical protein
MNKDNPAVVINPDHPLYPSLLKMLGWEDLPSDEERLATKTIKEAQLDWNQLADDYNQLRPQGMLAFLALGPAMEGKLSQALTRRGVVKKVDYLLFVMPVMAVESMPLIAAAPGDEIPEGEFADFACVKASPYPDPEDHPHIAAMDKAIPRRSNRHLTSDTLPIIQDMNQVYILKLSSKTVRKLGKQGRPRKSSA